jgi:hypothetical protein
MKHKLGSLLFASTLAFTGAFASGGSTVLLYKHKDFKTDWKDAAKNYHLSKQTAIANGNVHPDTGLPLASDPDVDSSTSIDSETFVPPMTVGSTCDDGDAGTVNTTWQADGTCGGGDTVGATTVTATYATTNGNGTDGYTAGVTPNAYLDADAKTAGTATIDGVTGVWDGTYWKPQGDATKVLSGDFKVQVNASDIGGVSGNGLIYTGTNAPFDTTYRLDTHFGVTSWSTAECNSVNPRMNSTNVCATRGMWLPTPREANINTSDGRNACGGTGNIGGIGVFSHPSGFMWTTASATDDSKKFTSFTGTSTNSHGRDFSFYVRCVR